MSDPLPLNFVSEQQQNTSEAKQKESKKDGAESDRIALKQFASLNSLLYIDCSQQASELSQSKILPGSVYYYQHGQYEIGKVSVSQRCAAFPIAIEVSPPCDFVNGKKVLSRLICGFIMSIKKDIGDGQNQSGKSGKGNKEGQKNSLDTLNQKKLAYAFIVGPFANSLLDSLKKIGTLEHITVAALKANASTQNPAQPADEPCSDDAYQNAAESLEVISEKSPSSVSLCYLALNLNHLISVPDEKLLENKEFRFLFRIENDVFADVLQKFSSHASRLGNSLLQLPSNKSKKG